MPDKNEKKCCLCGGKLDGYGHNAEPVAGGRCCSAYNMSRVIPGRIALLEKTRGN